MNTLYIVTGYVIIADTLEAMGYKDDARASITTAEILTVAVVDALPLPVCKKVRAERCRKVQGRGFMGWSSSKREWYFGWRLHWICDTLGVPITLPSYPLPGMN